MRVSIRDNMLSASGLEDTFEALDYFGLSTVELHVGDEVCVGAITVGGEDHTNLADEAARECLAQQCDANGVSVCAFLMGNNFSSEAFAREVTNLVVTAQAAEHIGVPVVRVDLNLRQSEMDEEQFSGRCIEALKTALNETQTVEFGIENHGGTSNRPEFMDRMLSGVSDSRLGLTLDTGNFYWYGYPLGKVYSIIEKYAPHVKHTHVKNIAYPQDMQDKQREMGYRYGDYVCTIYDGDVDHSKIIRILKENGYDRTLCIEDESLGQFPEDKHSKIIKKDVEYLKSLI